MIGIAILGVALIMLCLQVAELQAMDWRPWQGRRARGHAQRKRPAIKADWDRIQRETKLERPKPESDGETPAA